MRTSLRLLLVIVAGCGSHVGPDGAPDAGTGGGDGGDQTDASEVGGACMAPDMLVVLDRTLSMSRRPDGTAPPNTAAGHTQTKWYIAVTAIETLTAQLGATVQFGLELFPRDPGGGVCVTLAQKLSGTNATNPSCEAGQVVVSPTLSAGPAVATAIDPETTLLCISTPIGAALGTAQHKLAAIREPDRDQYVLFVGDGQDTCNQPLVLTNTDALAADDVKTFVVAFDASGTGIDNGLLNDMACAGGTAPGFPAPCSLDASGHYRATDRSGPPLYLVADDAAALANALTTIGSQVCCGCLL